MDNFELLSDDQLRLRLLQYGFANLPITQTTRNTLIKKLRNHINSTSNSLRKTTSLVTRYSSGEESDTIDKNSNGVKTRKARMTVSGSPAGRNLGDQNMPPPKTISHPVMSLTKPSTPTSSPTYRSAVTSSGGKKSSVYVSPVIINDSEDDDIDYSVKKSRTLNSSLKNVSARNRSDLYTTLDSSQQNGNGYEQDDVDDGNSTSDYTKRLLQLRDSNLQRQNSNLRKRTSYTNQRLSDYQPDDIVFHAEPSLEPAHMPLNLAIKNFVNRLDAAYGFKQTFVPMVLLSLLIVFFLLIVFAYVTISPSIENILNPATTLYVPCDESHVMDASYACIDEHSLESALNLLKLLAPELQARALAQRCGDKSNSISNVMCVKDFWHFLNENHPQNRYVSGNSQGLDMIKDVHNIEYLVDRNKQWGISNVDESGEPSSLDDVVKQRAHQAECFAILKPKLPITCTIYNKIQTFFLIIGALAIISLGVIVVRKFWQFLLHVKERRRAQIDQIIREICTTLMEKSIHDKENPSVVLNHLRDKIIEPSKRSELAWAWNEAITYLEKNDSRIHFGLETINSEDFKVIRWIDDAKNLSSSQSSPQQQSPQQLQQQRMSGSRYIPQPEARTYATTKKWMGSAFDKSNKIKDPPTNCLKIRQMFDKYEANSPNLPTIIQDTILQKLRDKNCKLYDIQLDLKTCCVYLKCGTTADAGIVHEEINGWWLDSSIIVVKFLKQEKYHQRFPSAVNANTCLQPSSNFFVTQSDNGNGGGDDYFDDEIDDDDFE